MNNTENLITVNILNIDWDVDNQEDLCELPVDLLEVELPADMDLENELADAVSDAYGFTVNTLEYEII
jgi:hypothetical protein